MLGFLIIGLIVKVVLVILFHFYCGMSGGLIACYIIGAVLEGIATDLMTDVENAVLRGILYYPGILLQLIAAWVITVPCYSMSADSLKFMQAIALGVTYILIVVGWFATGYEGEGAAYYYTALVIALFVEGLLSALMNLRVLLIINTVLAAIATVAIVIARIKLGSNLE
jgi:hypothetical protein